MHDASKMCDFIGELKVKSEKENKEEAKEKWNEDCAPNKSMRNAKKRHINSVNPLAIYLCSFWKKFIEFGEMIGMHFSLMHWREWGGGEKNQTWFRISS